MLLFPGLTLRAGRWSCLPGQRAEDAPARRNHVISWGDHMTRSPAGRNSIAIASRWAAKRPIVPHRSPPTLCSAALLAAGRGIPSKEELREAAGVEGRGRERDEAVPEARREVKALRAQSLLTRERSHI